jgi:RNA polymerase sigma factor (sigma-70 family)
VVVLGPAGAGDSSDTSAVDPPGREPTGSANVREAEKVRLIQEAIDSLPDLTDREILRRRFFESQTVEAIAAELGLTYDQVRYRCEKSLERLRPRLEGLL